MTKEQLQERINKLEVKIEKTIKNRNKYYDELSTATQSLVRMDIGRNYRERRELKLNADDECNLDMYYSKDSELRDYQNTLTKYQNQMKALNDLIEIPVLREFLNNWKESAIEYNIKMSDRYKELLNQLYDKYLEGGTIKKGLGEEFREELYELKQVFGKYIVELVTYYRSSKNEQIKKDIENEAQRKYQELVNRINNIVGEITNCERLRIGADLSINGIIEGSKGKAKVETIIAGGHNEHIIVNVKHGQCLHSRVLVRELN